MQSTFSKREGEAVDENHLHKEKNSLEKKKYTFILVE